MIPCSAFYSSRAISPCTPLGPWAFNYSVKTIISFLILWNVSFSDKPVQLPSSVGFPEQGMLPPVKLLLRFRFASLSHIPKHVPQGSQVDHIPSTGMCRRIDYHFIFTLYYVEKTPEQLSTSVAFPVHGVVPLAKLLVLFRFASLSHMPKHRPQEFHTDHEPSTRVKHNKCENETIMAQNTIT